MRNASPALGGAQARVQPVIQGDYRVSSDPTLVFSTILGSCVSVALFDPAARIGGMNHYLLPETAGDRAGDVKYGALAIELLINELLKAGAARRHLRAKLCGGAAILSNLGDIGARNAQFARDFMRREGFPIVAEDLGGTHARRFHFHPASGDARIFHVPAAEATTIAASERVQKPRAKSDLTLF